MEKHPDKRSQDAKKEKKGFWKGIIDKLDQAMVEKANQSSCCKKDSKGQKCC